MTEQLSVYIKDNLAKGATKEAIVSSLLQSGWTKEQIEQAFLNPDSQSISQSGQPTAVSDNIVNEKTGSSKKLLWIVILILFTLLLTGISIFAFMKFKKIDNSQPVSSNNSETINRKLTLAMTPVPTPSPSPKIATEAELQLLTKDWKVYRNEQYQFEIKYPPDWYLNDNLARYDLSLRPNRNDVETWLTITPVYEESVFDDPRFKNEIQNIQFNGKQAREKPKSITKMGNAYSRYIRIDDIKDLKNWKQGNVISYQVLKSYPDVDIFNTIVSTFKFIN